MIEKIIVTVAPDGRVAASTSGILGDRCLDYIAVLEDLLAAQTVESSYTADYSRNVVREQVTDEVRDVERP